MSARSPRRRRPQDYFNEIWNSVFNVSYVSGSHNVKFGINHQWGYSTLKVEPNGDMQTLRVTNVNGVETANAVDLRNTPFTRKDVLKANLGIFAQDKWTTNRLTLMYGARYDYFNGMAPATDAPAGRFVPGAVLPRDPVHPVLERLVDSPRRVLRHLRHRQDRAQSVGRQVPGAAGASA